ncbi:hypothetical protein IHE45_05G003600 [Dioscorea alata]|uniref:Uncharacterized protein n=1 Tax=Dioscorea alata TaxID=55571 RepID=A0ACB7VZN5_DIOAL|nr:hypothetical protein IHE45_05G003600 [Dioscorea alata]
MAQKKKHLRELLREEQEPFLLKSFIQERRVLLRRRPPSPKKSSTTALVPSTPANAKSPLFLPSNSKTPSLFSLAAKKTPSSSDAINPTAYYILEAALRIQEKQSRKHARTSIRGLGIGFFGSVLKRLVSFRKPRREIQARDVTLSIKDILVWDSPHAGDCRKRIQVTHCLEKRRSASHGDGNHGMEKNGVEDKTFCFSSSEDGRGGTSSCSDENRSPEFESPAASPTRRKPELVSGTGPEEEYDEEQRQEKEQQLSPVSVLDLDPTLEEEEGEEDHLERHVDSYERSLAIVQRAKQQLMHHLRRFQRLTSLDPIELDRLLAEEELDDADYDLNNSDSHIMLHTHNQCSQLAEEEEEEEACSCSPSCVEKSRMDMKKLTMDLIDEEKYTTEKLGEEEEQVLLEKVRQRFEAWKEVESNTIDMMVSLDLRHETQGWGGRCKEQMLEIAALLEAAIFELLIFEFSDELTNYDHHYHHHHQQQQQQQLLLVVS